MARTSTHYLILIALLVATSIALAVTVETAGSDEAGIYPELPDLAGDWVGDEIRFCWNPRHQAIYTASQLEDINVCPDPECGGELGGMTLIEKSMLPSDTVVVKKRYTHPDGRQIIATIVMSGKERASIHRPETCLVGHGSEIATSRLIQVPLEARGPLDVRILDMLRHVRIQGVPRSFGSYYAYWFVGKGRETASHHARMFWMAADRVLHNKSHRWAYIAISGDRPLEDPEQAYEAEIKDFIAALYPQMVVAPES
ncbi:MAG TPA: exosortase-associated EpsI family protein [Kiritimatiellia bacterium]|nr:exosortase-associated EpsI family protein [Kiritimatiellia bacterium]HMO98159.1 exosortase-associated EpsI family protein [Kiritimatiellia bacterium]HMP96671.1 exosortase-associated EpsI family protein [Kiritimatiellia bacterium]